MCLGACFCLSKVNCILPKAGPWLRKTRMWQPRSAYIHVCLYLEQRDTCGVRERKWAESHIWYESEHYEKSGISVAVTYGVGTWELVTHCRMGHHHHYHHDNDTSLMIIMTPRQHLSERYRVPGRGRVLTPRGDLSSFESVSTSSSSFVCQFLPPMLLFTPY